MFNYWLNIKEATKEPLAAIINALFKADTPQDPIDIMLATDLTLEEIENQLQEATDRWVSSFEEDRHWDCSLIKKLPNHLQTTLDQYVLTEYGKNMWVKFANQLKDV